MSITAHKLTNAFSIIKRRLDEQGLSTTLLWIFGRGLPGITGIPLLRFCEVTPFLFVGSQYRNQGKKFLEEKGINADLNMRVEFDDAAHGLALKYYCHVPTVDDDAPSLEQLHNGINFIHKMHASGEKVYIHCGAGVGRAPTMAAAYLIETGLELEQAIATIKKARPFIYIMPPQMARLKEFAEIQTKNR